MKRFWGIIGLVLLLALPVHATITSETTRASYTCNGVLTTFAYPFRILEDADLLAIRTVTATGAETTLALNTDYTVTGAGAVAGGNVVLTAASKCPSGSTITVMRDIGITQETDYVDGEAFSAASFEDALDKVTMVVQQQQDQLNRIPTLKKTSGTSAPTLADPVAGEYLRWNLTADGIESTSAVSSTGNFTQSGTGATERTVDAKIGETVSVKDFGAVGDGSTDDTTAIQYALNTGKAIYFPYTANSYKITDTLNVTVAGTKIISDSKAEIRQATAAKKGFNITVSNVTVRGLTLTGYQHAAYNTGETAIYATGTDNTTRITDITVEDCTITNWGWEGIRFDYVDRATARFNYLDDIVYSGIQGRNANYTDFSHNTITDITPGTSGLLVGITLSGSVSQATASKHGRIAHNYIYNTGQAILLEPAEHVTITGNDILDCITGIDVKYHTTGGVSKDITVTGNNVVNLTLTTTQQKGIDVAGDDETTQTENVTVTGNTIYGYGNTSDGRGAIQTGAAKGVVVSGNNIANSQKYGILIGSYTDYSIISENNIYGMQTVAGSAGILVGTACDYTAIQHNNIDSGAYVGINVSGANPKLNLRGNVISTTYTSSISGLANCIPERYRVTTATTVTGATTGDLKTYVIGEDTISAGNSIRFEAAGTKAGGTGNKQIDIVLGTTTITAHAAANNTNDWRIVGTIMFSASNAQQISWACWDGATITQGYDSATKDTAAGDVTLKLSAVVSGAGDTVVQRLWIVEKNF